MPAIPCNKLIGSFAALAVGTAGAVESDLGAALAVPTGVAPTAVSNFQPDAFFTDNLTRLLQGHFSGKTGFNAETLAGALTTLGIEARRLTASQPVPPAGTSEKGNPTESVRPVLTQSVCLRTHEAAGAKALLITIPAKSEWARRTALLWDWVRRTPTVRPVWVCSISADAPDAGYRAAEEILKNAREQRLTTGFNGFSGFSGHLALEGRPTRGFVNFAGLTAVTAAVADRYIKWQDTSREKTNAYAAADAVQKAWRDLPTTFQINRAAPYVGVAFSPVVCRKDWAALLTSACTFRAAFTSRAKASLTETAEAAYEAAQTTVGRMNGESRTGARRDLTVSFPENYSWPPATQTTSVLRAAWEKTFAGNPDAVLSSRFVVSPAAVSANAGLTAFTLGTKDDAPSPNDGTDEKALLTLVERLAN